MILSVENQLADLPQTLSSYVTSNISAGGTAIPIRNTNSFTNQYAVQVGKTGQEQSEIKVINTPSGTILPINGSGTLVYDHPLDTPVFSINYNQIIFMRSTTGTSGTATALATVSITPDSKYTEYDDTSGAATYAYKTYYYNSVTSGSSSQSDWFTPAGPAFYSLGKLRSRGKAALYNSNYLTDNTVIDDWVNEWVEEMTNAAIKVNKGYAIGTASYAFGTAGYGTITEAGFKKASKIETTWNSITYTPSNEIPMNEYSESDNFSSYYPRHSWEGNTVFRVLPFGSLGTARFSFGKLSTALTDEIDNLPLPLRSYTTGCVEYILYRALGKDEKDEKGNVHYARFMAKKKDFINEMTPRDSTGIKTIDIVTELTGRNDEVLDYII